MTDVTARSNTSCPAEARRGAPAERIIAAPEYDLPALASTVLLAIDTSLGTSVALGLPSSGGSGRIVEATSDDPRGHSELIGTLISRALELAGADATEVSAVVTGIGPGPFTGLRVGIAAAHAFAAGRNVPVLPLHGHEAVALVTLEAGAAPAARIVQDARRHELFVSEYSGLDWRGVPVRVADPALVPRAEYSGVDREIWPERIPAARLVQLALRRLAVLGGIGQSSDSALERAFEPNRALYLRAPDVRAPAAPKRVTP